KDTNTSEAIQAARNYSKLVYFLVNRYQGRVRAWEIGNEPDIKPNSTFPPGINLADDYLYAVLMPAYNAATLSDPSAVILIGGLASFGGDVAANVNNYEHFLYVDPNKYPDVGNIVEMGTNRKVTGRPEITDQRIKEFNVLVVLEDPFKFLEKGVMGAVGEKLCTHFRLRIILPWTKVDSIQYRTASDTGRARVS
ncbi:MAG: hypothetical protein ACP5I4_11845, partial [Oceanipulchritudo sp.]